MGYYDSSSFSLEFLWWDSDRAFQLNYASLHLEQARVGRVGVCIEHFDLLVDLHETLPLLLIGASDLLAKLVFFVQRSVLAFDDVHLQYSPRRVFLCLDDLNLSPVVLKLRDNVNQYLLEAFKLSTESH